MVIKLSQKHRKIYLLFEAVPAALRKAPLMNLITLAECKRILPPPLPVPFRPPPDPYVGLIANGKCKSGTMSIVPICIKTWFKISKTVINIVATMKPVSRYY
jgi:hypothetical protein